jgi:branched-chain amino acid aminotransferase
MMSFYVNHDDKIVKAEDPLITAGNRGFRYGDGLFETMRMIEGTIPFFPAHMERLFGGLVLMGFNTLPHFTPAYLEEKVATLARLNGHSASARVRLMIFRGNGNLYGPEDNTPHYIIETSPFTPVQSSDQPGIITGVYEAARKAIDSFSHLKSNNFQPYLLAALHARKAGWADSIILNTNGTVCESTIANIFIIKDGIIITPSLAQGCIAGVMRKHLLTALPAMGYQVQEAELTRSMLKEADEVFLTNSVQGVRWVAQLDEVFYHKTIITRIGHAMKNEG